jgi:hypothetical protein
MSGKYFVVFVGGNDNKSCVDDLKQRILKNYWGVATFRFLGIY